MRFLIRSPELPYFSTMTPNDEIITHIDLTIFYPYSPCLLPNPLALHLPHIFSTYAGRCGPRAAEEGAGLESAFQRLFCYPGYLLLLNVFFQICIICSVSSSLPSFPPSLPTSLPSFSPAFSFSPLSLPHSRSRICPLLRVV